MTDVESLDPAGTTSSAEAEVKPAKHAGLALVLILTAQLMVVLDSTIANIALPYIGRDLDISQANLTWIVTGYALAFGGLLLLGGRLGDLYGRRRLFMIGLSTLASLPTRACCSRPGGSWAWVGPWPLGPRSRLSPPPSPRARPATAPWLPTRPCPASVPRSA